jgi:hypothetical protein
VKEAKTNRKKVHNAVRVQMIDTVTGEVWNEFDSIAQAISKVPGGSKEIFSKRYKFKKVAAKQQRNQKKLSNKKRQATNKDADELKKKSKKRRTSSSYISRIRAFVSWLLDHGGYDDSLLIFHPYCPKGKIAVQKEALAEFMHFPYAKNPQFPPTRISVVLVAPFFPICFFAFDRYIESLDRKNVRQQEKVRVEVFV